MLDARTYAVGCMVLLSAFPAIFMEAGCSAVPAAPASAVAAPATAVVVGPADKFAATTVANVSGGEDTKTMQLLNLGDPAWLTKVNISPSITASVVADAGHPGTRFLEVHVPAAADSHGATPAVSFGAGVFPKPVNLSHYSRIDATIGHPGAGFGSVYFYMATLPYSDGGRNLEFKSIIVPGGATVSDGFSLNALERNDPSAIQLAMFLFPPGTTATVYRIYGLQATYNATDGSPVETMRAEIGSMRIHFAGLKRMTQANTEQAAMAAQIDQSIDELADEATAIDQPTEPGKLAAVQAKYQQVSEQIGAFPFLGQRDFYAWTIDPYRNFIRTERPGEASMPLRDLKVSMARNEFRDAVFMVSSGETDVRLKVGVTAPGAVPASAVLVEQTQYLPNRGPTPTGDEILPLTDVLPIPEGESRQIRIRFDTQNYNIRAGTYPFTVTLTDLAKGMSREIPGVLHVWDFALPPSDVLPFNSYAQFDSSDFKQGAALAHAIADMKTFGMNIAYIHPSELPRPAGLDANGRITGYDDAAFLKRVKPIQESWDATPGHGRLRYLLSVSGMYDLGLKSSGIEFLNPRWKPVFAQWLHHLKDAMRQAGVQDGNWMMTPGDESEEAALVNNEIPMAEAIKSIDPGITLVCNTSHMVSDPAQSQRFFRAFDIFQPDLVYGLKSNRYLRDWLLPNAKALNKPVWTYQCAGDLVLPGKNVYQYYRVYAWDALNYGLSGLGLWTYCAQAEDQAKVAYVLVYNHNDEVAHARRYEVLRDGMNDYRYVWLLRNLAARADPERRTHAETMIQNAIADITTHPRDSTRCDLWRGRVAAEISTLGQMKLAALPR